MVVVDALDQLAEANDRSRLAWIPARLPAHVRMVLSASPGGVLELLESQVPSANVLHLKGMPVSDARTLLDHWLRTRAAPWQRVNERRSSVTSGVRGCRSICSSCSARPESGIHGRRRSGSPHRSRHGARAVRAARRGARTDARSHSLGLLAAARDGLAEDELLDLLSSDAAVMDEFQRRASPDSPATSRLPYITWSRLYFDLEPYLIERRTDGANLLAFFHRQLLDVAERVFLGDDQRPARHAALAAYFTPQPWFADLPGRRRYNTRKPPSSPSSSWRQGSSTRLTRP